MRLVDLAPESGDSPVLREPTVQEWTVTTTEGGTTTLRLVHSGFPDTEDWDDIYDSTGHGWDAFLLSLRHYLQRHSGRPRRALVATAALDRPADKAWESIRAACGITGDRFGAELPSGEALSGPVLLERPAKSLLAVVDQLDDGLLFVTLEPGVLWASLAAFGTTRDRLDDLGDRWHDWITSTPARL